MLFRTVLGPIHADTYIFFFSKILFLLRSPTPHYFIDLNLCFNTPTRPSNPHKTTNVGNRLGYRLILGSVDGTLLSDDDYVHKSEEPSASTMCGSQHTRSQKNGREDYMLIKAEGIYI